MLETPWDPDLEKRRQDRTLLVTFVSVLAAAILGYWFFGSPYVFMAQLRDAASKGDREALSDLIDFPSVRESLREEMNAAMMKVSEQEKDNPFAALGMVIGGAMAQQMVEAYVTPSAIAALSQGRRPPVDGPSPDARDRISEHFRFRGLDRFSVAYTDSANHDRVVFNMRRSGLGWRLTSVRLPVFDQIP